MKRLIIAFSLIGLCSCTTPDSVDWSDSQRLFDMDRDYERDYDRYQKNPQENRGYTDEMHRAEIK